MPVTFDGTVITVIWEAGDLKGDSWLNPYTPEDIYQASLSGGWGVVDRQNLGSYAQYYIKKAVLLLGDEITFVDFSKTMLVIYDSGEDHTYSVFFSECNLKAIDCSLAFEATETPSRDRGQRTSVNADDGVYVYFAQMAMLSAETWRLTVTGSGLIELKDVILRNIFNHYQTGTAIDNVSVYGGSFGVISFGDFESASGLKVREAQRAVLCGYGSWTLNGFEAIDCVTDLYISPLYSSEEDVLIDSVVDPLKSIFINLGDNRAVKVFLKSTFNIYIEGEDVEVKLYDKNEEIVIDEVFTDSFTDIVTYHYFEYATGVAGVGAVQIDESKQPFRLIASKSGFSDLEIKEIVIEPGNETTIRGQLVPPIYIDRDISGAVEVHEVAGAIEVHEISGTVTVE